MQRVSETLFVCLFVYIFYLFYIFRSHRIRWYEENANCLIWENNTNVCVLCLFIWKTILFFWIWELFEFVLCVYADTQQAYYCCNQCILMLWTKTQFVQALAIYFVLWFEKVDEHWKVISWPNEKFHRRIVSLCALEKPDHCHKRFRQHEIVVPCISPIFICPL